MKRDAITILTADHHTVEALFKKFEKASKSRTNRDGEKAQLRDQIVKELAIHTSIEEQIFYPTVRQFVKTSESQVLEALEEHNVAKWLLSELRTMQPSDERFDAKMTVLIEGVRHHKKEEETELFPTVKKSLTPEQLVALGEALLKAKTGVSTTPQPALPDTPPGNLTRKTDKLLDDLVASLRASGS